MPVKKMLFISPTLPSETGSGLAMRAYRALQAFAQYYEIDLLVPDPGYTKQTITTATRALTREIIHLQLNQLRDLRSTLASAIYRFLPGLYYSLFSQPMEWRLISKRSINRLSALYQRDDYDLIHIFRCYMIPFAQPFIERSTNCRIQLDIDDIESMTRYRISVLYLLNGDEANGIKLRLDSAQYERLEREYFPKFTQLIVCSESDRDWLTEYYHYHNVAVVPNTVPIINHENSSAPPVSDIFRLLFVGSLGYYPNQDALSYFCREILPIIRAHSKQPLELRIIGRDLPSPLATEISKNSEVKLIGWVEDLVEEYRRANVVIAPIRAGGGTRIKILEAFAHHRPVVTTTIGVEGIKAEHEHDLLIADTPTAFAEAILALMNNSELCLRLAENGYRLLNECYHPKKIETALLQLIKVE